MSGPVKILVFAITYGLLGNFALQGALALHIFSRPNTALIIGGLWILGWIWGVGALIGGPRAGNVLLRSWIATVLGLSIFILPFALFPHPGLLIAGGFAGFAVASYIMSGRTGMQVSKYFKRSRHGQSGSWSLARGW